MKLSPKNHQARKNILGTLAHLRRNYHKCKEFSSLYCGSCFIYHAIIPALEEELEALNELE